MDKNNDGKISMDELKVIGLDGLPNFEDLGAEGHHYDVESGTSVFDSYDSSTPHSTIPDVEFFLHHEGNVPPVHQRSDPP